MRPSVLNMGAYNFEADTSSGLVEAAYKLKTICRALGVPLMRKNGSMHIPTTLTD